MPFKVVFDKKPPHELPLPKDWHKPMKVVPADSVFDRWGLVPLDLTTEAADFYLLMRLELMGADAGLFAERLELLSVQFSRYTDMAVGGELRHASTKVAQANIPTPIARMLGMKHQSIMHGGREAAWRGWLTMRQRHGAIALKWARDTFGAPWLSGAYGGPKWANIADTLWRYESGVYGAQTFVDTCWGLEHNGGCYFSKAIGVWNYNASIIQALLNANLGDDTELAVKYATTKVRKLWKKGQS